MSETQLLFEVRLLAEAKALYGLSWDHAAKDIGSTPESVRRWLKGEVEPSPIFQKAIREAVDKWKAEYDPKLEMHELKPGVLVSSGWWGSLSGDPKDPDPAEIAEQTVSAKLRETFVQLMKAATDSEKYVIAEAWPGYAEVVKTLAAHGLDKDSAATA